MHSFILRRLAITVPKQSFVMRGKKVSDGGRLRAGVARDHNIIY